MKYNLCDEEWILLMGEDGTPKPAGLRKAFLNMNRYLSFCGEIRLQDTAMLRLFAAIAVTMMYRYDTDGRLNEDVDWDTVLDRYQQILRNGQFPEKVVNSYFDEWYDRFYLLEGEHPFFQVPLSALHKNIRNAGKKTEEIQFGLPGTDGKIRYMNHKDISCINGTILESGNKASAYADLSGTEKHKVSYAEAARWLIWYMAYADCGTKAPGKWASQMTFPSMGANIYPTGKNLFETVMLNSVLLYNGEDIYNHVSPAWEREPSLIVQDNPYGDAAPRNLPELYTQQSRRVMLEDDGSGIIGAYVIAGDKYSSTSAFIEPMFMWKADPKDKTGLAMITVKYNMMSSWENLRNILLASTTSRSIRWINQLEENGILDGENIPYLMTGISYGSMQSSVDKMLTDSIVVSPVFFIDSLKIDDMRKIIEIINNLSTVFYLFGCGLAKAEGAEEKDAKVRGGQLQVIFQNRGEFILRKYLQNSIDKKEARDQLLFACRKIIDHEMDVTSIYAFCKKDGRNAADEESIAIHKVMKILREE